MSTDAYPKPPTEPRPLTGDQLEDEDCNAGDPAVWGTWHIEDRSQHQSIIVRRFRCDRGHTWTRETDGG